MLERVYDPPEMPGEPQTLITMRNFWILFLLSSTASFGQIDFPFDFEAPESTPEFVDFEMAETTVVANPNINDNNPSDFVAKMVRNPGGEIWAGSIVTLPAYLDLSEVGAFRLKIHSPMSGTVVKLKLEGLGVTELDAITTVANDWETLEWDFTGAPSGTFNQVAFMLDFGLYGDGSGLSTFYFDDVELFDGAGDLLQVNLPITHEDEAVHYQTTSFAGSFSETALDPIDETNTVTKVTKHWLALDYAGTTVSTPLGLAEPIAFEPGYTTISVDVFSPAAGVAVRLKAEEYLNMANSVETQLNTTTAYEWETLTFDLSQPVPGTPALNYNLNYTILSVFFDFGNPGYLSGTTDYYYDNVVFNGNPTRVDGLNSTDAFFYPSILTGEQSLVFNGGGDTPVNLHVFDMQGRLVQQEWVQSGQPVHLHSCTPGMYVLRWGQRTQKITVAARN